MMKLRLVAKRQRPLSETSTRHLHSAVRCRKQKRAKEGKERRIKTVRGKLAHDIWSFVVVEDDLTKAR